MRIKLKTTSYYREGNLRDTYLPIISRSGFVTEINLDADEEPEVRIEIDSFEDLIKLHKELGIELILTHDYDTKEPIIEISDSWRE